MKQEKIIKEKRTIADHACFLVFLIFCVMAFLLAPFWGKCLMGAYLFWYFD